MSKSNDEVIRMREEFDDSEYDEEFDNSLLDNSLADLIEDQQFKHGEKE